MDMNYRGGMWEGGGGQDGVEWGGGEWDNCNSIISKYIFKKKKKKENRQASKPWQVNRGLRQRAGPTGKAIYSQIQKVTSLETASSL